jgi:biotin-(acetyl-CoA carboxylase) ligase
MSSFKLSQSPLCPIYNFDEVGSTMDKAKELARSLPAEEAKMFAVRAKTQSNGRGTKGRSWASPSSNLYMTVAISTKMLPLTWGLIPLR